ncbi:DUF3275 family protein [Azotobacter vinelandii]|uniref:DUF3275 family protein n=1 Tax=Azotobacter vinelandii TaxID=354 RepID=UPI00091CCA57|nr:DUF3275 family protein [Azotobacter vinelandii]WKN23174.1 DUF3275 family protein [Azotobacter vinelandii]SFY09308.1 Protein of unknown function [Azotobacter vinelandii]
MITLPGQLAIRTIHGRNGDFNVARLATSIGEFVVKDSILDQYAEGRYSGQFCITQISPSSYTHSGRTVIEVRARLDSMTLDEMDQLTRADADRLDPKELDPLDEETAESRTQPTRGPRPPKAQAAATKAEPASPAPDDAQAPFGMEQPEPAVVKTPAPETEADAVLFGLLWPLGETVKLDTTVDRSALRAQCKRLGELGYTLDFKQQLWLKS